MNLPSARARPRSCSGIRLVLPLAGWFALAASMPATAAEDDLDLTSNVQRMSYMIGLQVGASLGRQGLLEIDPAALAAAVDDVLNRRRPRLSDEQMQAAHAEFQASRTAAQARQAAANLSAGEEFLASNRENEGVVEMPDGIQYRILRAAEGASPSVEDAVVVHYRGRLLDGTEFDSSYQRGEPAEFTLGGVIPGWQLALQAMPQGSHWEVWIPAALAYGEQGAGGAIGPNQVLHFEIELLEIKSAN
ncbi:MAG: FKBP-type peptidyl-prolyl cis-trans isomerase [Immundisolibacterales bacterium]|nr:FKBP-type peptidyl-prolyl cis-trans isomerase [Immundisolibacterales bacterium]